MSFDHDPLEQVTLIVSNFGDSYRLYCQSCGFEGEPFDGITLLRSSYERWLEHLSKSHRIEKPKPKCSYHQNVAVEGDDLRPIVGYFTCSREKHSDNSHELVWTSRPK